MATEKGTVLVTGGAQRIGEAIVRAFAGQGYGVVIHHRNSHAAAQALAGDLKASGTRAHVLAADFLRVEDVEALIGRALGLAPDLRVLVNSASVFELDQPDRPDFGEWSRSSLVNAYAPARLAADLNRHVDGGVVINLLDQKLANPNPDYFSYTASKAALAEVSALQAMAFEGRTRLYRLYPGITLPSGDQTEEEHQRSSRLNLLQRATLPGDVAEAAVFLASGALRSGEAIFVDGGQHLTPQKRDVMFLIREEGALGA